eukprot:TRINITY_DN1517_c0_g1_i1.p1 TRINITY_DN1517_c0_g1~~TRINITY_DN1517_c0_g1_i1.p1  ORF type:complete len:437 (-),score=86.64 TRINITY_DN1517_c0_g1_i1:117-1364(-)
MSTQRRNNSKTKNTPPGETTSVNGAKGAVMLKDNPDRWKKWWTRTYYTLFMIFGFALIIYVGHFALVVLVLVLQIFGFREFMNIRQEQLKLEKLNNEPLVYYKLVDVYLFALVSYFMYGYYFITRFSKFFMKNEILAFIAEHHTLICFFFFCCGVVTFVLYLKKGYYKLQFKQIVWTVMCLVAMSPSSFHIPNIFNGIIWFLLPCSLIICNDIFAFIWGFFFGKTPLIKLSPKKTWEGFLGAFISTLVFGYFFSMYLSSFSYFTCPKLEVFGSNTNCEVDPLFLPSIYTIPQPITFILSKLYINVSTIEMLPIQLHSIIFSTFASFIGPFGGFIASGFKRAFNIKDFGDVIPGHGGIIDRMDCQVIMALFTYIYYNNIISMSSTRILNQIASLPPYRQVEIYYSLENHLVENGFI